MTSPFCSSILSFFSFPMKKSALLITTLALVLGACATQTNTSPTSDTSNSSSPAMKRMAMEWTSQQTGTGSDGIPQNKLILRTQGTNDVLFTTSCNGVPSTSMQDVPGSVVSIQCWWAGGGEQFGVFVGDAEEITVRHRTVDEEGGFGSWEDETKQP